MCLINICIPPSCEMLPLEHNSLRVGGRRFLVGRLQRNKFWQFVRKFGKTDSRNPPFNFFTLDSSGVAKDFWAPPLLPPHPLHPTPPYPHLLNIIDTAMIEKKTKFFSYVRKFRWDRFQSHIWRRASKYIWGNAQTIQPYMRRPLDFATDPFWISIHMRKIWFSFFYQCVL